MPMAAIELYLVVTYMMIVIELDNPQCCCDVVCCC